MILVKTADTKRYENEKSKLSEVIWLLTDSMQGALYITACTKWQKSNKSGTVFDMNLQ